MTNIAERVSNSTLVWRLGILVEDVRNGTMSRYLRHRAWERIGRVTSRVDRASAALDGAVYDQWVLSGRTWERRLEDLAGSPHPHAFFLHRPDRPLTTDERKAREVTV